MRALKFVKYLPRFGWSPIVLTVKPDYYRSLDHSLLAEVPADIVVVRTDSLQSKGKSYQTSLDVFHSSPQQAQNALRAFRQWIYRHLLVHQDEDFLWLPWAWAAATRVLCGHPVDVILTTSPPHCVHWLGLALQRKYKLPWVVDLRDGWLDNAMFRPGFAPRYWIERRIERGVVCRSNRILTATEPIRDALAGSYPTFSKKMIVLPNGFDPADFAGLVSRPSAAHFDLVYVGSMGGARRPVEPLLQATAQLLQETPGLAQVMRLRFVGSFGPTETQLVEQYALASVVTSTGWVEHRDAIQHVLNAHVLILISTEIEGGKEAIAGKVFEYLAAERPILALVPEDAAVSRLVCDAGIGVVALPTEVNEIAAAIRTLYERFRAGALDLHVNPDFKRQFSRLEQTRTLAGMLAEIAHDGKS